MASPFRCSSKIIHARYNEFNARYDISTGDLLSGELPRQAHRLVQEWIALNKQALMENWRRMEKGEQMEYIKGLE